MTLTESINKIESTQFAVEAGLANSFRIFLRNISGNPAVKDLLELAKSRPATVGILERIQSLTKLGSDFRYLNRFDVPLATYLWILSRTAPELATVGAEAAAHLPRTWWTEQVARYVLEGLSSKADAGEHNILRTSPGLSHVDTSNVHASSSLFIPDRQVGFASSPNLVQGQATATANSVVLQSQTAGSNVPQFNTAQALTLTKGNKEA